MFYDELARFPNQLFPKASGSGNMANDELALEAVMEDNQLVYWVRKGMIPQNGYIVHLRDLRIVYCNKFGSPPPPQKKMQYCDKLRKFPLRNIEII